MKKFHVKDFINSAKEEGAKVVIGEMLPTVVKNVGETLVGVGVGELIGDIASAACPIVNNIRLNYKQKLLDRNITSSIQTLIQRQDELEEIVKQLQNKNPGLIQTTVYAYLDNISDEIQEEMVVYNTNGYVNLLKSDNKNIDTILMFFETMNQLNYLDVRILKLYNSYFGEGETISDICQDCNLEYGETKFIRQKLERLGLLVERNEKFEKENLEKISKYLHDLDRESKKSRPGTVRFPNLKSVSKTPSYSITLLGRKYLELMDSKTYETKENE